MALCLSLLSDKHLCPVMTTGYIANTDVGEIGIQNVGTMLGRVHPAVHHRLRCGIALGNILNKHGSYFLKLYQHRSYVLALKDAHTVDGMYVDADKKGLSFRDYGEYLLLGGGSHRTGKKGATGMNWESSPTPTTPQRR